MEESVVKALPKVELHCHLDGSVRPEILSQLAQMQGVTLPYSAAELATAMSVPADCTSLLDYLKCFDVVLPLLQQAAALELIAYDLVAQVAAENVCYIEVRYAPMLFTHQGLTLAEIITAVSTGLARGAAEFKVRTNSLICGMRHHTLEQNKAVVAGAKAFLAQGVVGFDLAGDEANHPAAEFTELIAYAHEAGFPLTLHAGECGCPQNVRDSIALGATRIGHGIAIEQDPELLAQCVAEEIVIEMCPTSNLQTKAVATQTDYPFPAFYAAGAKISLNTDNRTVSNTTLTKEYLTLHDWYGIDYNVMAELNYHGIDGAFTSEVEKEAVRALLDDAYHGYR